MKKEYNIAIIGLGQIGSYLYKEILAKRKEIQKKTGKIVNVVAISAKSKNKKRKFKINKNIFFSDPLKIISEKKNRYYI